MSRILYTALLFAMTAVGFGEFNGSLSGQINAAKDKTVEADGSAKQAVELAWDVSRPAPGRGRGTAVAGVRG